jgi:hypothetical protein
MMTIVAKVLTRYWRWRIHRAGAVIPLLDKMMIKAGYNRVQRRQFWRDFTHNASLRRLSAEKMLGLNKGER